MIVHLLVCNETGAGHSAKNLHRINELIGVICKNAKSAHQRGAIISLHIRCMIENQMFSEGFKLAIDFLESIDIIFDLN